MATATPSTPPAFGEAEVSDNDRPPLASVAPRQSHPARDHADALERGGLGAGPRPVQAGARAAAFLLEERKSDTTLANVSTESAPFSRSCESGSDERRFTAKQACPPGSVLEQCMRALHTDLSGSDTCPAAVPSRRQGRRLSHPRVQGRRACLPGRPCKQEEVNLKWILHTTVLALTPPVCVLHFRPR